MSPHPPGDVLDCSFKILYYLTFHYVIILFKRLSLRIVNCWVFIRSMRVRFKIKVLLLGRISLICLQPCCSPTPSTFHPSLPPCPERLVCIDSIEGSHAFRSRVNSATGGSHRRWEGRRTMIFSLPEIWGELTLWPRTDVTTVGHRSY